MKRDVLFFIFIFSFIIINNFVYAEVPENSSVTGNIIADPVTGKLTSQQVAMSIFVQTIIPYIELTYPKNQTYLKNESILLNYTLNNGDSIWYNLDNSDNITINSWVYINASEGPHILYIFANNTNATIASQVSFTVNSSKFIILFDKYKGANKGSSTDFIDYTYEDIQNLENIILEDTNYGKIRFNYPINMTDDRINTDNLLDLDSNILISSNKVELNSTELSNFNKSATIWLYNLNFLNPRILKDNQICPAYVCIKEDYSGGTLKFNVTHFTSYSAEETPSTPPVNPPSGGGGGGSSPPTKEIIKDIIQEETLRNITIVSKEIRVSLKQGEDIIENIYIMNNYLGNMKIKIDISNMQEFVNVSETEFELSYEEIKEIKFNFSTNKNTIPDNYVGKILVNASGEIYEILVSIDVQSRESLLDIRLKLDEKKLPAYRGGFIWFKTDISNLGDEREVEIGIKYTIKDSNGKTIFEGEGTDIINTYLEKNGKIKLPKNIPLGKYILSAKVNYGGKTAVSSATFEVKNKRLFTTQNIIIGVLLLIVALIILGRIGKREKRKREEEQEEKRELIKNKRRILN